MLFQMCFATNNRPLFDDGKHILHHFRKNRSFSFDFFFSFLVELKQLAFFISSSDFCFFFSLLKHTTKATHDFSMRYKLWIWLYFALANTFFCFLFRIYFWYFTAKIFAKWFHWVFFFIRSLKLLYLSFWFMFWFLF